MVRRTAEAASSPLPKPFGGLPDLSLALAGQAQATPRASDRRSHWAAPVRPGAGPDGSSPAAVRPQRSRTRIEKVTP